MLCPIIQGITSAWHPLGPINGDPKRVHSLPEFLRNSKQDLNSPIQYVDLPEKYYSSEFWGYPKLIATIEIGSDATK